ncbi:hypothetical protein FRB99_005793, partial [Tulasnella sp. 403]
SRGPSNQATHYDFFFYTIPTQKSKMSFLPAHIVGIPAPSGAGGTSAEGFFGLSPKDYLALYGDVKTLCTNKDSGAKSKPTGKQAGDSYTTVNAHKYKKSPSGGVHNLLAQMAGGTSSSTSLAPSRSNSIDATLEGDGYDLYEIEDLPSQLQASEKLRRLLGVRTQ